jgi:hypothetical protein
LYGEEAPTESKELATKIRELQSIVNGSKKALDDMVAVQAEFWKGSMDLLPGQIRKVVGAKLQGSQLWTETSSAQMRELLGSFAGQPDENHDSAMEETAPSAPQTEQSEPPAAGSAVKQEPHAPPQTENQPQTSSSASEQPQQVAPHAGAGEQQERKKPELLPVRYTF